MPRRRILSEAQRAALLALPTSEAEFVRHWTLSDDDLLAIQRRRRPHNRLGFALQLCALRHPGRLLRPNELIPEEALQFVADQLGVDPGSLERYAVREATRYHQLSALREIFGFRELTQPDRQDFGVWLLPVALATTSGAAVVRTLVDELRRRRIALPRVTLIEAMASRAMLQADRHVAEQLNRDLTSDQRRSLEALLVIPPGSKASELAWVRQPAGAVGHRAFRAIIDRLELLRDIDLDPACADGVHPERMRRLAMEGARMSAQHLTRLSPKRRRAVLVATALETSTALTDDAVSMFERTIGKLFRRAEARENTELKNDKRTINNKLRLFAAIGDALIKARETGADPLEAVEAVVAWDQLEREVSVAHQLVRPDTLDPVTLAATHHAVLRGVGRLFLATFEFGAVPAAAGVLRAVEVLLDMHEEGRRKLPDRLPTEFLRPSWRRQLLTASEPDRRAYELCVFVELRDRLRAGDVWVEGSRAYRAVEEQLIPKTVFVQMRRAGPLPVAVSDDCRAWLAERREALETRAAEVNRKAETETLEDVRMNASGLKISPLRAITPEAAEILADRLHASLPRVRITELLAEVDRWTNFSSCFTHLQNGRSVEDPRVLLTAILAEATNLGHSRMAEACSLVSRNQLAWTSSWHMREETYGQALARIVEAQHASPLARLFGPGTSSSSDGQHFQLDRRARGTGDVNPHKGSEPAVSFYTHVSDRYAPFHAKVISATAGEAAHVLDGLLYHSADLQLHEHHTDGGGVSDHVFALCHLLGFRFAPRIPNIGARRLYVFDDMAPGPALAPHVAGRINTRLISAHWDEVLRLASSVRTGVVGASQILKRLGAYPKQNGLALALREIGRVERTLFTLDWIDNPEQRRRATRELNKGEAENALKRAVFFHRIGRVRDRSVESQANRASGLNLVSAAIVLWNTTYLQLACEALALRGERPPDDLLRHISPLSWQHINLTGDYIWGAEPPVGEERRALKLPPMQLAA